MPGSPLSIVLRCGTCFRLSVLRALLLASCTALVLAVFGIHARRHESEPDDPDRDESGSQRL
jgi:hypothetical protein